MWLFIDQSTVMEIEIWTQNKIQLNNKLNKPKIKFRILYYYLAIIISAID